MLLATLSGTVLGSSFLGGCISLNGKGGDPLPQITFDHLNMYPLYVASYELQGLSEWGIKNVPEDFTINPAQTLNNYLHSRFEATGMQGKLLINIQSVDVDYKKITAQDTVSALVGVNKKDYYRVTAVINLSAHGVNGIDRQEQSLTLYRDIYTSENVSLAEREKGQMKAMDHMIDDLDIALRKVLHEQFGILKL